MNKLSKFGERLTELMSERGVKSEEFGERIGISGSVIRRWCKGDCDILRGNLVKVAEEFGCSVGFLVGKTDIKLDFKLKRCPQFYERFRFVLNFCKVSTYNLRKNTKVKGFHIHKWKNGSDPKLSSLLEICDYLGVTIDFLIGLDD